MNSKLETQKALALDLLAGHIEGSFSTAFLEAFIRADRENMELLSDDFEVLSKKFSWTEKIGAIRKRLE